MAAGGLSYSGLVNHGKINLPSVESWGTNINILKDPPKSITTRRIDRVGDTSSITQMIEESDGRTSEAIQVYARGVNPSVSVSYNNLGNNGGQTYGGITEGGRRSAKLPYRIMQDGAFRPPVFLQKDLLPLSRLPRNLTTACSNACFPDFSRKLKTAGTSENTKEVKTKTLKAFVRPTAVYHIETQAQRPFEVKYAIQPSINNSVSSGMRTMDITQRQTGNPTKEINRDLLHSNAHSAVSNIQHVNNNQFDSNRFIQDSLVHPAHSNISSIGYVDNNELESGRFLQNTLVHPAHSNISSIGYVDNNELESGRFLQDTLVHPAHSNISSIGYVDNNELESGRFLQDTLVHPAHSNISSIGYVDNNELESGRFLQDTLVHPVSSNVSSNSNHTSIEDILDLSSMPIHNDIIHYRLDAPISGVEQTKYFHDDIALSRNLPHFIASTNAGDQKVFKRSDYDNKIELQRNNPSASCESNRNSFGVSDNSSREARLAPKISAGGYSIPGQIPMKERNHIYHSQESEKAKMNRIVMESMNGRFNRVNPFGDS